MGKVLFYCMCLLASTALLHASPVTRKCEEIRKVVTKISQHVNKTHPHTFHVPIHVKVECHKSALTCFRSQFSKLRVVKNKGFDRLVNFINLNKSYDYENCTPCSNYTIQSPGEFLNKMELLLQKIISDPPAKNSGPFMSLC